MAKKDDSEVELVKNIILDVLKSKLNLERCDSEDSYKFHLYGKIDRGLIIQGSLEPIIKELNAFKYGVNSLIDKAIKEMLERME